MPTTVSVPRASTHARLPLLAELPAGVTDADCAVARDASRAELWLRQSRAALNELEVGSKIFSGIRMRAAREFVAIARGVRDSLADPEACGGCSQLAFAAACADADVRKGSLAAPPAFPTVVLEKI